MLPFIVYSLPGLIFGLMSIALASITTTIAGSAELSIIGCGILVIAGVVALVRPRIAAYLAMVGLLGLWQAVGPSTMIMISEARSVDFSIIIWPSCLITLNSYAVIAAIEPTFLQKWPAWVFPGNATGRGRKALFWLLSVSIVTFVISDWLFVGRTVGTVTYEMSWSYEREQKVVLSYINYSNYSQACYSEELAKYLQSTGKSSVPVTFKIIKDYGSIRGYFIDTIGQWENKEGHCDGGSWSIKKENGFSTGFDPGSRFMKDMVPKESR